jgi:hypothetical protein
VRAKLRQPASPKNLDRFRQQPTQLLDRLRLAVVLSQVLVDELTERQRAAAASFPAHPLERPLERLTRIPLGRETTPLHTP